MDQEFPVNVKKAHVHLIYRAPSYSLTVTHTSDSTKMTVSSIGTLLFRNGLLYKLYNGALIDFKTFQKFLLFQPRMATTKLARLDHLFNSLGHLMGRGFCSGAFAAGFGSVPSQSIHSLKELAAVT